ncbi:hypothetical protein ACFSTD_09030 [Novosphingobium colocasiae]
MAEIFTRKRHMALPSIVLLGALVVGAGIAASDVAGLLMPRHEIVRSFNYNGHTNFWTAEVRYPWQEGLMALAGAAIAGICAVLHWLRFRIAITVAAAIGAAVLIVLAIVAALTDQKNCRKSLHRARCPRLRDCRVHSRDAVGSI